MRVTLISVSESISAYGLRVLAAVLKRAGFEARLLFLPRETEGAPWDGFCYPYSAVVLDQLAELASDSGLIGLSLMTNYFANAVQITGRLRQSTDVPIVWGGIHPTLRPEECLQHADLVCVGEGEDPLLELAQQVERGAGYRDIANIWYREKGELVRTALRPLQTNLDVYPYPDYDLDTSFVLHRGRVRPLTHELLLYYARWPHASDSVPAYETLMSRGCSFRCAYCCNDALRRIYPGQWHVRRRSVPHLIGELRQITTRFPGFQLIRLTDDEFISDMEMLREFCAAYRQAPAMPLEVDGWKPPDVSEERVGMLVDAGMCIMHMGVQTGSMRTMHQLYRRPVRREQIVQAARILHWFVDRLRLVFDLIIENPWETEQDELETLAMLLELPRPYYLQLFTLTFFPGTRLCARAQQEGLLHDEDSQVYQKHYLMDAGRTYVSELFRLIQGERAPFWLIRLLAHEWLRQHRWTWLPALVNSVLRTLRRLEVAWRALCQGDWQVLAQHLRYRFRRPQA